MRAKKMFISAIFITTALLFAGGCGKQAEPVSAEPMETVKEVDTEESVEPTAAPTALPEESMESSEVEDNSENEVVQDTTEEDSKQNSEYKIIFMDDTVMYATANCNIMSGAGTQYDKVGSLSYAQKVTINGKVETDEDKLWYVIKTEDGSTQMVSASMLSETKPAAQTSSGNGSGSDSNSGGSTGDTGNSENTSASTETASNGTAPTQPASTPEPVHTHSWKEHTATKQVWVPNIVVVDDYEYQVVGRVDDVAICNCGFTTTSASDIESHVRAHGSAGENTSFTIQPGYDIIEQVKVGSHEEDRGHNETQTYVDYYYCDCGATK